MSKIRLLSIGTRFLIIVISIIGIIASTAQIRNPTVSSIYNLHYDFIPWSQTENVLQNGYVVAFISNFRGSGSEKPDMYSEDKIKDIVQKYGAVAKTENENRYNLSDDDIDIIYILNESFCDPDEFAEYYSYSGGNLLPNLHEIQKKSATGHLFSPAYGGGTANVEFEALTGFSNYFLIGSLPFQDILPKVSTFPSVASMLKSGCEYQAWGLHPFTTEFYRRSIDYPIMGFDAIYGAADMNNTAHDRTAGYISDKSAYAEVFEMLNGGNDKNFITLITMQNHSSYGGQYAEHQFHITSDIPDAEKLAIDDYMELLHSSDAALGNLIESVDKREKKTVVVFWGDHLPGIYSKLNEADKALLYQVPFLIHSNFAQKDFDLGVVSPNYISTALFDYLEVEKPPFYYLLDDVKGETPVLTNNYYEKHSPLETDALIAYRMIEYDTVSGKGYAKKLGFFDILETQANQATQSTSGIAK
ncbi:MAG: LTA synthase family protein [Clostridiales Family XIII bacterium]|nr:LTA synthase family protein [Clostridiales Family XIII bacterium]